MAGVVAMASVIEDFETQPCKKACKDVDNPVVKTITSYFSPVAKPAEKPFSPPRSNNIMDYFNRKGPSPKNKVSSPNQSKENCQTEKVTSPQTVPKQPTQKRSRKAARKLVETATPDSVKDTSFIIIEERESTSEVQSGCGIIMGSKTAVLLGQVWAEPAVSTEMSEIKNKGFDLDHKSAKVVRSNQQLNNSIKLSPILPLKDKSKKVKTVAGKKKKQVEKQPDPELKETDKSLGDVSMEVNIGDASQLNNSTVTISFEEFVRSQDQEVSEQESETVAETPNNEEHLSESRVQISPQTVTILAEVHSISPKAEVRTSGKVASIFSKRSPVEVTSSSPQTDAEQPIIAKWKSNVVLPENDVELCVLESSSTAKCSQAERKQFMAAFKQPSFDKTKPSKTQGKQKQTEEKTADAEEEPDTESTPSVQEKATATSQDKEVAKKKPVRKRRKVGKEDKDDTALPPVARVEETEVMEVGHKIEEHPTTSTPSAPAVRRSKREAVVRQTSKTTMTESTQYCTKDTAASSQNITAEVSTPKKRKHKHGVFKAEMVCPADVKESPIRIKFTRVSLCTNKAEHGNSASTPLAPKTSKKTKQAKKLLEKAKAMKQNKRVSTEGKTLRRSSRTEASIKRSYCEDEDSVICVEETHAATPQSVPEKGKSQKSLRSLNDVLGKAAPNKETKTTPGTKVCPEKASRKASLAVSIFDDSSREGSENSQDDEQFKARREFLMSGLPESFKKQMAKTAATKEAYVLACSSFQPVVHISQPPYDCTFWSLPWPESTLLIHLKEIWCHSFNPPSSNSGLLNFKTLPVPRALHEMASSLRPEISTSVREKLMKEISSCNPVFPAHKFMSLFMKRRTDLQQCTTSEAQTVSKVSSSKLPPEAISGKRKRTEEEGDTLKVSKKHRSSRSRENICTSTTEKEQPKKEGRPRRGQKTVSKEDETKSQTKPSQKAEDNSLIVLDDSPLGKNIVKDVLKEDTLWTEKYQPQHSCEVIGNTSSVTRLHSWLKEWKLRADKEDRKKTKDKKQEEGSVDSDWESGEEDSQDGEDMLCNTMLITGPTGVGKTAAVYACAQELGFKVFEVNASSQRSGRLILSQLKEATQSHQVDSQGVNAHKPTYFNSYSSSSSAVRPGSSPRKVNSPRRTVSSPRKLPQSPRGTKRGGLAPTALAKFFKMAKPGNKEQTNTEDERSAVSKKKPREGDNKSSIKSPTEGLSTNKNTEEQSKKTATSLILFEEVDVIFDDDTGFLAAIKTFMTTTKRPVILTTSDPAFSAMFDGNFEEIIFQTPTLLNVSSYLQLLCLAEDSRTDPKDINCLLSINGCDIRKTMLQLQFWSCSGGGQRITKPLTYSSQTDTTDVEMSDPDPLPVCDTGCTESMLGLHNIEPQRNIWELVKEDADCSKLVILSKQQGVDLLYSNMETLLPLPTTSLRTSNQKQQSLPPTLEQPPVNTLQAQKPPPLAKLLHKDDDFSDDASPVKVSNRMKRNRRRHGTSEQEVLQSDSDSEDDFLSIKQQKSSTQEKETVNINIEPKKVIRKPLTPEEKIKSIPVSQCLQSLSDFLDNMSFIDLFGLENSNSELTGSALVKDGLTDEARIETEKRSLVMVESGSEIHAAVQSLSFNKCRISASDAWDKVQQLNTELREEAAAELSLPVATHSEKCTFTQQGPCQPLVVQRKREVMDELMLKGVFGFGGNRPAAAQDYLPALRTICRSETLKEQGKVKRRFLHYLDAIHLGLQKSTLQHLAEDFP